MTQRQEEDDFLRAVVNLAHLYGWIAAHHSKSARKVGEHWISNLVGDKGSPDLLLARAPRVILPELKSGRRYGAGAGTGAYGLTPEQKMWKGVLDLCPGVEHYVWSAAEPGIMETIAAILAR